MTKSGHMAPRFLSNTSLKSAFAKKADTPFLVTMFTSIIHFFLTSSLIFN